MVAGYFGLVGLIVTKDAKTSDLRQAWIDALRAELSQAVSHFEAWTWSNYLNGTAQTVARAEAVAKFRTSEASIRLRLNPSKRLNDQAFKVLDEMATMIAAGNADTALAQEKASALVIATQPVLKEAWERVKRGESWFQGVKATSIALVVVGILSVSYLIYRGGETEGSATFVS